MSSQEMLYRTHQTERIMKKKSPGSRSSVELAALRRKKLLSFLESTEPAWKDENHPELKDGAAAWVRKLRAESEAASRKRRGN
jgi:hypothetical protein